jgi:hypothetical protein
VSFQYASDSDNSNPTIKRIWKKTTSGSTLKQKPENFKCGLQFNYTGSNLPCELLGGLLWNRSENEGEGNEVVGGGGAGCASALERYLAFRGMASNASIILLSEAASGRSPSFPPPLPTAASRGEQLTNAENCQRKSFPGTSQSVPGASQINMFRRIPTTPRTISTIPRSIRTITKYHFFLSPEPMLFPNRKTEKK